MRRDRDQPLLPCSALACFPSLDRWQEDCSFSIHSSWKLSMRRDKKRRAHVLLWLGQEAEDRPLLQATQSESPYKAGYPSPTMGRLHSGAARALSRDFPTRTLSGPGALQHDLKGGQGFSWRLSKWPCRSCRDGGRSTGPCSQE